MDFKIERTVNILLIITCILVISHLLKVQLTNEAKPQPPLEVSSGDILPGFSKVVSNPNKMNLVIVLSENCQYCSTSIPFYKKIVNKGSSSGIKVVFGVNSNGNLNIVKDMLLDGGINTSVIVQIDRSEWKIPYVPTILLINQYGKVLQYWKGQLNEKNSENVLEYF